VWKGNKGIRERGKDKVTAKEKRNFYQIYFLPVRKSTERIAKEGKIK
jgi:hypothetical protein